MTSSLKIHSWKNPKSYADAARAIDKAVADLMLKQITINRKNAVSQTVKQENGVHGVQNRPRTKQPRQMGP